MELIKTQNNFAHEIFGALTTITNENNDVFFIGKEVANILEYTDIAQMTRRLDDEDITRVSYQEAKLLLTQDEIHSSGIQLLTESGLYSSILGSKKPEAKAFKKWVTSEVLPTIRKTGSYSIQQKLPQTYLEALKELVIKEEQIILLEEKNAKLQYRSDFVDVAFETDGCFSMEEVAKINDLSYGRNTMMQRLRDKKILTQNNTPYQSYVDKGYFKVVEELVDNKRFKKLITTTYATQKGVGLIYKLLKK